MLMATAFTTMARISPPSASLAALWNPSVLAEWAPGLVGATSMLVDAVAAPTSSSGLLAQVQSTGETMLGASFVIAVCQAMLALTEYQSNPKGQLIIPPGPTAGLEHPPKPQPQEQSAPAVCTDTEQPVSKSLLQVENEGLPPWFDTLKELESIFRVTNSTTTTTTTTTKSPSHIIPRINQAMVLLLPFASNVFRFVLERNVHLFHLGFLVALAQLFEIPHRQNVNFAPNINFAPNTYVSIDASRGRVLDSREIQPPITSQTRPLPSYLHLDETRENKISDFTSLITKTGPGDIAQTNNEQKRLPKNVLVLGDSLAAGIGTVNVYEQDATGTSAPIPNINPNIANNPVGDPQKPGPVFPSVLAQTLALHTGQPVHWRSAAVVGGDTQDIEDECFQVLQEEVDAGRPPEVLVWISGINDLKHFMARGKSSGPLDFRSSMSDLIQRIHAVSPGTKVILPALPTQMFRRDSPLNSFPLVFFVSAVVGMWDAQKKIVARRFGNKQVEYVGISGKEIYSWYMMNNNDESLPGLSMGSKKTEQSREIHQPSSWFAASWKRRNGSSPSSKTKNEDNHLSLISVDGIHPNARCYAHWAHSLGNKIMASWDASMPEVDHESCPDHHVTAPLQRPSLAGATVSTSSNLHRKGNKHKSQQPVVPALGSNRLR